MEYTDNYWVFFYAIACAQGLFLGLILLSKSERMNVANKYLATLTLLLALYLFDIFLVFMGFFQNHPQFLYITAPLWYLFPVILFFYIKQTIGENTVFKWSYLIHLLPLVFVMFWFLPFYFLTGDIKLEYMNKNRNLPGGNFLTFIYYNTSPVQLLTYIFLSLQKLNKATALEQLQAHYKWLYFLATVLMIFGFVQLLSINVFLFSGYTLVQFKHYPLATFSVLIYTIGYLALIKPNIIFPKNIIKLVTSSNSVLTQTQLELYANKIIDVIEREKLYLNPEIKYTSLAEIVGINARYISEVLNRKIGKSFSELINGYRVKEVQKRLLDKSYQHISLLEVAMDSGFNSKSSFNRIFKKHIGITPSEYTNIKSSDRLQ